MLFSLRASQLFLLKLKFQLSHFRWKVRPRLNRNIFSLYDLDFHFFGLLRLIEMDLDLFFIGVCHWLSPSKWCRVLRDGLG